MQRRKADRAVERRRILVGLSTMSIFAIAAKLGLTRRAVADDVGFDRFSGRPQEGRISLKVPEIAEDGNTVPLSVFVESPMTPADHVQAIRIIAARNPQPILATFTMNQADGRAEIRMRVRLAQTQSVTALAAMSDGTLWSASQEVKVTIGGCGGG